VLVCICVAIGRFLGAMAKGGKRRQVRTTDGQPNNDSGSASPTNLTAASVRRDPTAAEALLDAQRLLKELAPNKKDPVDPDRRFPAPTRDQRTDRSYLQEQLRQLTEHFYLIGKEKTQIPTGATVSYDFSRMPPAEHAMMMYLLGGGPAPTPENSPEPSSHGTSSTSHSGSAPDDEDEVTFDPAPRDSSKGSDIKKYTLPDEDTDMPLQGMDDMSTLVADPGDGARLPDKHYRIPKMDIWKSVVVNPKADLRPSYTPDEIAAEARELRKGEEDIIPEYRVRARGRNTGVINIRKFDYGLLRPDYTVVFYGRRRLGKTNAMVNMMKAMRPHFGEAIVFTPTKIDLEYAPCVPDSFIYEDFNEDVLDAILDRQVARVRAMRKRGVNDENISIMLIFDDCVTETALRDSRVMRRLFFNGRHYHIFAAINAQDQKALSPALRANTDMVFIFRAQNQRDQEAVRTNYMNLLSHDRDIDKVFDAIASVAYNTLVVDLSRPYMSAEDTYYAARFPDKRDIFPFFMGSRMFWRKNTGQLCKYGGQRLLDKENWDIVNSTYHFNMTGME
jgi:hypothetical protein